MTETLHARLRRIRDDIQLGMNCDIRIGSEGRGLFVQIRCYREDTITKQMGYGFGGKAYPSEHATDSEIIQMIFGLYKSYWEHEARETFIWRGRRPFGPHISTEALWEVARRVDVRSQRHEEDNPEPPSPGEAGYNEAEFEAHVRAKYGLKDPSVAIDGYDAVNAAAEEKMVYEGPEDVLIEQAVRQNEEAQEAR